MEIERRLAWGPMAVDYQDRINMDRLRSERLAKTRAKLKEKGVAAAILTTLNMRYAAAIRTTAFMVPGTQFAVVFADGQDTVVFMHADHAQQTAA